MIGESLGKAVLKLTTDDSELDKGLQAAYNKSTKIGKSMQAAGKNMSLYVTAPIVAAGAAAFKFSTDFNAGMANVATLIPNSVGRVNELKGAIQNMAMATGTSTTDLAAGMYQVISAFGDGADSVAKLDQVNRAAIAGVSSATDALNLLSAVTKGYGDETGATMGKVSDMAFLTVKLGQTTFPELASAMGKVVPIASTLNVSQEELFASFSALTGVAGTTAEVSTKVTQALVAMLKPNKDMAEGLAKVAEKHGDVSLASAQNLIQTFGMKGAFEELSAATGGSTEALGAMFGSSEAIQAVLGLTTSQANKFDASLVAMANSAGATDEAFREQMEGVNKAGAEWKKMKATLEVVGQTIGDAVAPIISKLAEIVGGLAKKFAESPKWVQVFVIALGGVAAAVGPVLMMVGQMLPALTALSPVLPKIALGFKTLWAAVTGPVGIVITILTAVGTALYVLYQKNETFRTAVRNIWAAIKDMFQTVVEKIVGWLEKLPFVGDKIKKKFDEVRNKSDDVTEGMDDTAEAAAGLTGEMEDVADVVDTQVNPAVSDLSEEMQGLYDSLDDVIFNFDKWKERVSDRAALNLYKDDIVDAGIAILDAGGALSDMQMELVEAGIALQIHQGRVEDSKGAYDDFQKAIEDVNLDLTTLKNKVDDKPLAAIDIDAPGSIALMERLDEGVLEVAGAFGHLEETVTKDGGVTDKISKSVSTVFTNMSQKLADNIFEWSGWKDTLIGTIEELGRGLLASVLETFLTPLMDAISEFLTSMISGLLSGLSKKLGGWLSGLFGGGGDGVDVGDFDFDFGKVGDKIGAGIDKIGSGLSKAGGAISTAISTIGGGIVSGLSAVGGAISGAMSAIWSGLAAAGPVGWIGAIGAGAFFGIKSLIGAFSGPNSYEALTKEIARDFGGVNVPEEVIKAYMDAVGITEEEGWDIRKNIATSPSFLLQVVGKYAEEQGKIQEFLKSLEAVQTSWGQFDFRTPFELGLETGDWEELNRMWEETSNIGSGAIKQVTDNFADLLIPVLEDADETLTDTAATTQDAVDNMSAAVDDTLVPSFDLVNEAVAQVSESNNVLHETLMQFDTIMQQNEQTMLNLSNSAMDLNQQLMALDAEMQNMSASYATQAQAVGNTINFNGDVLTLADLDRIINESIKRAQADALASSNRA